jgi:hypothetical protein
MSQFIKVVFCATLFAGIPFVAPTAVALPAAGQIACAAGICHSLHDEDALVQEVRQRGGGGMRGGNRGSHSAYRQGGSRASMGGGSRGGARYASRGGDPRGGVRHATRGDSRQFNRGASGYGRGSESRQAARGGQRYVGRGDTRRGRSETRYDRRHDGRYSRHHDNRHNGRHHGGHRHRDDYHFYYGGGGWLGYYGYPYGYNDYYDYYDYGYASYTDQTGHVQWCLNRYRSYDPATDTFLGYDGEYHRCNSPFS